MTVLDDRTRSDIHTIFTTVRRGGERTEPSLGPHLQAGFGKDTLHFEGETERLLRSLQERLSGSTLGDGGHHPETVKDAIVAACSAPSPEDAVAHIEAVLALPLQEWMIVQRLVGRPTKSPIKIGGCVVHPQIPSDLAEGFADYVLARHHLEGQVIVANVRAHDAPSARLMGNERIEESKAILMFLGSFSEAKPPDALVRSSKKGSVGGSSSWEIFGMEFVSDEGSLWPGFLELSAAADKSPEYRTDWERRTLAAARWYRSAARTVWPSQALVSAMTAMECIGIGPGTRDKGRALASLVAERARVRGVEREELFDWIRTLYRRRNFAVHEGMDFSDEISVGRLLDLTHTTIHWAIRHLDPWHRGSRICQTFEDAMSDHDR